MILRLCCVVAMSFAAFSASAADSEPSAEPHPVIGSKPPNVLLASDIMALPESEQQAWIHGGVAMLAQAVENEDAGKCVMNWYFEGDTAHENLVFALKRYSDSPASAIVFAVAQVSCPEIKQA